MDHKRLRNELNPGRKFISGTQCGDGMTLWGRKYSEKLSKETPHFCFVNWKMK